LQDAWQVSERRSCAVLRFDRSSHRYRSQRDDQAFLRHRIREIAAARVRYGYRRIWIVLRREGLKVNHKRVRRLYREEGLNLRIKRPCRHVSAAHRAERIPVGAANDAWSMDFVSDALFDGRRLRALTLLDIYTREALAIEVDQGSRASRWSLCSMPSLPRVGRPDAFGSTMAQSSFPTLSTAGLASMGLRSISVGRASPPITPSSNRSTGAYARSA